MPKVEQMQTVPNQRIIKINKEKGSKTNLYTSNVIENINKAMQELNEKASFKLYMYLAKNQNSFEMALSSSDFMEKTHCGRTAYRTAFKELIKKCYLVQDPNQSNKYNFYDKAMEEVVLEDKIINQKIQEFEKPSLKEFSEKFF